MPTIGCLSRLRTFRTKSSISSTESGSSCKPREQSALRVQDRSKTHAHAASNARGDCGQRTGRAHNKARAHTPRSVPTLRYGNTPTARVRSPPSGVPTLHHGQSQQHARARLGFERARKRTGPGLPVRPAGRKLRAGRRQRMGSECRGTLTPSSTKHLTTSMASGGRVGIQPPRPCHSLGIVRRPGTEPRIGCCFDAKQGPRSCRRGRS